MLSASRRHNSTDPCESFNNPPRRSWNESRPQVSPAASTFTAPNPATSPRSDSPQSPPLRPVPCTVEPSCCWHPATGIRAPGTRRGRTNTLAGTGTTARPSMHAQGRRLWGQTAITTPASASDGDRSAARSSRKIRRYSISYTRAVKTHPLIEGFEGETGEHIFETSGDLIKTFYF